MSQSTAIAYEYAPEPVDSGVVLPNLDELRNLELVYEDGVPLESLQHHEQMELLIELTRLVLAERGRTDSLVAGNNFVYYSMEQAEFVATHPPAEYRHFTGPDFYCVTSGVKPSPERKCWVAWKEGGRYPDMIVELLSPSTAHIDRGIKKDRYERIMRIPEYYLYKPGADQFQAFNLDITGAYQEPAPNERGWVWSHQLGVWLGLWHGRYENTPDFTWLRFYDAEGRLIPTKLERLDGERQRADGERQRADGERRRADRAEAELARLQALLAQQQGSGE